MWRVILSLGLLGASIAYPVDDLVTNKAVSSI